MIENLKGFEYLWNASEPGWVLVHLNSSSRDEEPRYFISNLDTQMGELIEDNDVFQAVVQRMLSEGVRVVDAVKLSSDNSGKETL